MSFLRNLFQSADEKHGQSGTRVDAMLVICVHEPDIPVTAASGKPLMQLAKKSLATLEPGLVLHKDAYARFSLMNDGPAPGMMPGGIPMPQMPPGVNPRHMAALMGAKPMSTLEKDAAKMLPGEMTKLLRDRGMDPADYEMRSFSETPDPGVKFLWMAAVRK